MAACWVMAERSRFLAGLGAGVLSPVSWLANPLLSMYTLPVISSQKGNSRPVSGRAPQTHRNGGSMENMKLDPNCKYDQEHEWVRVEGDEALVGISDYAQDQLSDVVYVELPEVGDTFDQGDIFAVVESVKAASDVYMPVSGDIVEINETLEDSPELVNEDPYGQAWFARVALADPSELDNLMDAEAYQAYIEGLEE
jgi:glycine cleavage system H protein